MIRTVLFSFIGLIIISCGKNAGECRGGLGAVNGQCSGDGVFIPPVPQETQNPNSVYCTATVLDASGALTNTVSADQNVSIRVIATGGTAPYSIPNVVASFASETAIAKSFPNTTTSSLVVQNQIQISDSANQSTQCTYNVVVLPAGTNPNSALSCNIQVSPGMPMTGTATQVTVNIVNGQGTTTFNPVYPQLGWNSPEWTVPVTKVSDAQGVVSGGIQYLTPGARVLSTSIVNNGQTTFCSLSTTVMTAQSPSLGLTSTVNGEIKQVANSDQSFSLKAVPSDMSGTVTYQFLSLNPSVQMVALNDTATITSLDANSHDFYVTVVATSTSGQSATSAIALSFRSTVVIRPLVCNVSTGINNTAVTGAISKVQVTVPAGSGVGPFVLVRLVSSLADLTLYESDPNLLWHRVSFRRPGAHLVTMTIRDTATNVTSQCSTVHVARFNNVFSVGTGNSTIPKINVYAGLGTNPVSTFIPFESSYVGAVKVAMGDVDADGSADVIVGAAPSSSARVKVFHAADLGVMKDFNPFSGISMSEIYVGSGDVNGDGKAEIVAGSGCSSSQSRVRVYDAVSDAMLFEILPWGNASGGARVALGDVNGDGYSDIVAAPCRGTDVKIFSGKDQSLLRGIIAFPNDTKASQIAVGDVNGDGFAEVIVGAHGSSTEQKFSKVFDGRTGTMLFSIAAFPSFSYDSRVAVCDINNDGIGEILIGAGGHIPAAAEIKIFDGRTGIMASGTSGVFQPFGSTFIGNIFLGAGF